MRHPYHMVQPSPWPFLISINLLFFMIGFASLLAGLKLSNITYICCLSMVILILSLWLYDILTESLLLGEHSYVVSKGLISGFLLFILTEIMLFFSLFWAYFDSALNPTNCIWPPVGINLINPWAIPLLNTMLLFYSGVAATWAHHSFIYNNRNETLYALFIAIILGFIFMFLQALEYTTSSFDISDSVYGSSFFMLTGGHGLHVMVGIGFLIAIFTRLFYFHNPNTLFDLGLLYYHFVDIVWIILFILIYYLAY